MMKTDISLRDPPDPREQHFLIPAPGGQLKLFLRYLPAEHSSADPSANVLYVHGASFPSALSIAHRFDGQSWRDKLNAAGFDVWGLDFLGFGFSDRYPEMSLPAESGAALCRTADAADQIRCAVQFILAHQAVSRLSIIAHSWGSMPTCHFASSHPTLIDRLVLFAPIAQRDQPGNETPATTGAWNLVTVEDQWKRFVEDVPPGIASVLSEAHFDDWANRYLDSDPGSRTRNPASVKVPAGPISDISLAWQGLLSYDPALVRAPVALIRGEWDNLITDQDARWLFDAFAASPIKRDVKIARATHLMHLEAMRYALYDESINFLLSDDLPPDRTLWPPRHPEMASKFVQPIIY
jgi:pimeloyl-ACP methyl ester carboxylesterase